MPFALTLAETIPTTRGQIYDAWLDSTGNTIMTDSPVEAVPPEYAAFTTQDGYISGRDLVLRPDRRIVQPWGTTRFTPADADSRIEMLLGQNSGGIRVTLHNTNAPDVHTGYQAGGWQECYFEPAKRYFLNLYRKM
jgi:hypothetical protein